MSGGNQNAAHREPTSLDHDRAGLEWYNGLTETERRYWHDMARSVVPADAWQCFREVRDELTAVPS